ncbi:ATP-binding protein [Streptomonospora sediminis]
MSEQGGSDRGIRAQLNRIVLIPSITFLALFAVLSTLTLTQAVSLRVATGDGRTGVYLYYSMVELQRERRLAAQYAIAPSQELMEALRRQGGATDDALAEVDSRAGGLSSHRDSAIARSAERFFTEIDKRSDIRDGVMTEDTAARTAISTYDTMIAKGIGLYDSIVHSLDNGPSAAAGSHAVGLLRAQESFTRGDAVLSAAMAEDRFTLARQTEFAAQLNSTRSGLAHHAPALEGKAEQAHQDLVGSAVWRRMNSIADTAIGHKPEIEVDPASGTGTADRTAPGGLADWRATADDANAGLVKLADAQIRAVITATGSASTWMFNLAVGGGIISLFAGTVAYGSASRSAARLTARLSRLRADTLSLARDELPRIVRRLADAEHVDLDSELRRLDHGCDEVGQVADAFNTAQRTAVSAAVKEAETRAGANRVFLAIAHRNQSLVQRQLQLLDRVEREEEDPDLLEDLFHLDHLATRGRRNAENLIILGGGRPGRRWRNPIPLMDILRGAISETDEYTRVKVRRVPDLSLSGAVVADVIHLVAELIENATAFSPPHTMVNIHSEVVPKGVAVEVEDRGLGMSSDALDEANTTLENAPEFDVMALNRDSRLGLFVVARLAAKHNVHVRLCPSPYGGTRAVALIPAELISRTDSAPQGGTAAPAEPGTTGTGGDLLAATRPSGRRRKEVPAGTGSGSGAGPAVHERPDHSGHPENAEPPGHPDHHPTEPVAGQGQPAGPAPPDGNGGERPPLPRRRRQANLAPQLRHDPAPTGGGTGAAAPASLRAPEDARRMMSAFQSGTRQGRSAESGDADPPRPPGGGEHTEHADPVVPPEAPQVPDAPEEPRSPEPSKRPEPPDPPGPSDRSDQSAPTEPLDPSEAPEAHRSDGDAAGEPALPPRTTDSGGNGNGARPSAPVGALGERSSGRPSGLHTGESE